MSSAGARGRKPSTQAAATAASSSSSRQAITSREIDRESRRIVQEELLTNLLVEAGAGSGKTQMLAERMAAGVASGVYRVEHMAAVTFTRKAASELRGRFHLALEQQRGKVDSIKDTAARAAATQRIDTALSNLERFFAGTIHSFCARLLRERPVESGVSPGFTELDERQEIELRKRTWTDFVTAARSGGDPDMSALLDADVRPADLEHAFATICANEDVEFPPGDGAMPNPRPARQALEQFWTELQKHLPAAIDPASTCPIQNAAWRFRGQFDVSRYRLDRPATIAALLTIWNCKSTITQKWWAESTRDKQRFRDLINPLHEAFCTDVVSPYLAEWRQYVYRLAVRLLTRARSHAAADRRRLNTLNYGDLLMLTARVLRGNAEVRHALQQKYQFLFVDEFQDTDPIQAEIAFLLAADEKSASDSTSCDWRTVALRSGALFVVGDPKQSIYRFRRADIDIYNVVRARFSDGGAGHVLPLTMNFRSVPLLCDWANGVFAGLFPPAPSAVAPAFAALDAHQEHTDTGGVFTLTHICDKEDLVDHDAHRIATYIRTEVDAGRRSFSDFLVLTRKKRNIARYASALEALNIPLEVSGAGAFGESFEVRAFTALIRVLADPQDMLALVAVLRGPFFGISDPELFAYRQSGGWFSIFAKNGTGNSEGPEEHRARGHGDASPKTDDAALQAPRHGGSSRSTEGVVSAALRALDQYYRWTRVMPAGAALERILEDTGYLALAATTPGGVEAGDLLHAVDRVRQIVEEGGTLADAADALVDDAEEATEVESLPLEPGRTDVVRVMNLHKAKGLEAKVVFLADPIGGVAQHVDSHIERLGDVSQGWFRVVKRSDKSWAVTVLGEHADWPLHEAAEKPYLDAEENRLLYVAATRAQQMLVISRWTGTGGTKAWGALNDALATATELAVPASASIHPSAPLTSTALEQQHALDERAAAHAKARTASWSITSSTSEARHIARIARAVDAEADDPTKVVATDTPAHRVDAGVAWGTLIHGLLEHAMRFPNSTRQDLRRLAVWLTVEEPQLRPSIEDAIDTIQRVAASDFWSAAKNGEHSEETPFAMVKQREIMMQGVIDLIFRTADGFHVRDYKTDLSLHAASYQEQLDTYHHVLRTLGYNVVSSELVRVRFADEREPGGS